MSFPVRNISIGLLAGGFVFTFGALVAQEKGTQPSSYSPVDIHESFASIMARMSAAKSGIMQRQQALLDERYDTISATVRRAA